MRTTTVFKCGNSIAITLPKDFQLHGKEVEILKRNTEIVLREIPKNLEKVFSLLNKLPDDFFPDGRSDDPP